jgi:transcriptional regulator with XRE-family HTH domain
MSDIKQIIAKNISDLRIDKKMTQLELAEILNYSDKAVSKWERAESIPDVVTLKAVADIFGVTVDYIITEHTPDEKPPVTKNAKNNHLTITWISVVAVWLLGTCAYTFGWFFDTHLWMAYVICVPVSAIVLLVFNSIWGRRILNMFIISTLLWSTFISIFLGVFVYLNKNIWMLFLIGIPAEVVIFLCFRIKSAAPSEANRFVETVKKRIRHSKKDQ